MLAGAAVKRHLQLASHLFDGVSVFCFAGNQLFREHTVADTGAIGKAQDVLLQVFADAHLQWNSKLG